MPQDFSNPSAIHDLAAAEAAAAVATHAAVTPRIVGWGKLTCPAGVPAWTLHDAYFTDVVDDLGAGDYAIHQVTHDANVIIIAEPGSDGSMLRQNGPAVAGAINMQSRTWTGVAVSVDAGTHAGTITGTPLSADFAGSLSLIAVKIA